MALTPAERRARRDASAQQRINPDTGRTFRNYNELDTWQRNQKAKAEGFRSRAEKRKAIENKVYYSKPVGPLLSPTGAEVKRAQQMPRSFANFLNGRPPTEALAKEFNDAFNRKGKSSFKNRAIRARILSDRERAGAEEWDWNLWREEYALT